jgi:hypothetical protein
MLDEVLVYWNELTPEIKTLIQSAGVAVVALLSGHILAAMVARTLRARNFDAALRLPTTTPVTPDAEHGITPTYIAGWLVRLSVWAFGAWWLLRQYGKPEVAEKIGVIVGRVWMLAGILVATLSLGSLLGRRLVDAVGGAKLDSGTGRTVPSPRNAAGIVSAAVYVFVVLLVLLMAADIFDWPLTRNSALALWQLAHHLLVAGAALLIGILGARWARELVIEGSPSPEKRAGQYTALGIVAATTVLAIAVLLSSTGVLIGLAALVVLGFLLWLVRGYLPDVIAGLQLRAHRVREVWFDGVAWQVAEVGFLTTQVGRGGEFARLQNRVVLEARMHAAPSSEAPPQ